MSTPETYELYAIRYAHSPKRRRVDNLMHPTDPHDAPMPMDFYVWLAVGGGRNVLIDTGSGEWKCGERGHSFLRNPADGLEAMGVHPAAVDDVIITHLHWDHAGNLDRFPNARLHLQEEELRMVTSADMAHPYLNRVFFVDDVCTLIRRLFDGDVVFHGVESEIAPGITVRHVGGHTAGMQVVQVNTRRGRVVLASDASHFYTNFETGNPFPVLHDLHRMVKGWDVLRELADSDAHIVPGHDPLVRERYAAASTTLAGEIVRLDVDPEPARRAAGAAS